MANVLITGGAGYIGSHACKLLSASGFVPVTIDNLSTGWDNAVRYGPIEVGDLRDKLFLEHVFRKYKPESVVHFAAASQVGESTVNPGFYWNNNVLGSLNLIETAVQNECLKFVFSSTCAVYGEQSSHVLDEECETNPMNAYAASKLAVEHMLENFRKSHKIQYVTFRYFNVAGADPEAEIGEKHIPETHIVPLLLDVALGKRDAFTVYGTDYSTSDGTCIRDYVHVCDIVDAHLKGLTLMERENFSYTFNLGTGVGFSVREVIEAVRNVTGKAVNIIDGDRRAGDCTKLVSGSNLAQTTLNWRPQRSNLDKMVSDAFEWHRKLYLK